MKAFYLLFSPHGMMRNVDWRGFVLKWTVLTAFAAILVGYLGTFALSQIRSVPVDILSARPGENRWLFAVVLLGSGLALGSLQTVALYRLLPRAYLWAVATAAGSGLAAAIGFLLFNESAVVTSALAVLLILILQTLVLNRVTEPRFRWIMGNLVSMIPATLTAVAFFWLLRGFVPRSTTGPAILLGHPASGMVFSLPFVVPFGLLFGVLTGDLLAWILVNKLRTKEGVPLIWPVS